MSGWAGGDSTPSLHRMSCCSDSGRSSLKVSGSGGTRINSTGRVGCACFSSRSSDTSWRREGGEGEVKKGYVYKRGRDREVTLGQKQTNKQTRYSLSLQRGSIIEGETPQYSSHLKGVQVTGKGELSIKVGCLRAYK